VIDVRIGDCQEVTGSGPEPVFGGHDRNDGTVQGDPPRGIAADAPGQSAAVEDGRNPVLARVIITGNPAPPIARRRPRRYRSRLPARAGEDHLADDEMVGGEDRDGLFTEGHRMPCRSSSTRHGWG
jgi:hypothetical protein